ncbi:hypothetical protein BGX31_008297 [Mortierella sp. GBA43]|nr:hypothetical protein BGX31_008297 [Mortierella sp. GBA43]
MDALNHHRELVKTMSFVGVDSQYISVPFPNLKRLDVLSSNLLWKLPHGLNNLTKLSITGIDIAQEDAATFWNMCTQLESLYIDTCSIPQLPEKSATFGFFNRLVDLYLYMSPRQLREKEAWWINWTSQLHNVIALDLDFHTAENVSDELLVRVLLSQAWSKLEELIVYHHPFGFRVGYNHWKNAKGGSSEYPVLQDSDDHQRRVLGRVSELVNLEHITLLCDDKDSTDLQLGLENGLEQLITLQKLETLEIDKGSSFRLTEADVKVPNLILAHAGSIPTSHFAVTKNAS